MRQVANPEFEAEEGAEGGVEDDGGGCIPVTREQPSVAAKKGNPKV